MLNIMNLFFFNQPAKNRKDEPGDHSLLVVHEPPTYYSSEGSEFLDDAIRMKDQPLTGTEKSPATDAPEDLL